MPGAWMWVNLYGHQAVWAKVKKRQKRHFLCFICLFYWIIWWHLIGKQIRWQQNIWGHLDWIKVKAITIDERLDLLWSNKGYSYNLYYHLIRQVLGLCLLFCYGKASHYMYHTQITRSVNEGQGNYNWWTSRLALKQQTLFIQFVLSFY